MITVSGTVNLTSAKVYLMGKLVPTADLREVTVERDFDKPDAATVLLAGDSYAGIGMNQNLEVKGRGDGDVEFRSLFSGRVVATEPAGGKKARTEEMRVRVRAFDYLEGRGTTDVPSPMSMVEYLSNTKSDYIRAVTIYLNLKSDGKDDPGIIIGLSVRHVLDSLPGDYEANKAKFAAKLHELRQLDDIKRRDFLRQLRHTAYQTQELQIGGYHTTYFFPPTKGNYLFIDANGYKIMINED